MSQMGFSNSLSQENFRENPQDSDNEIGETHNLYDDAGEQSLARSEDVKLSGKVQRIKGKDPAERERRRLKRLLRNRVSAQQARERKKAYVSELEKRVKGLETKNTELDERLSTLQKENHMLRHIIKNTTSTSNS